MTRDRDSEDTGARPMVSLFVAMMVVVLGTACFDWTRLPLLLVPLTFLCAANEAGRMVGCLFARRTDGAVTAAPGLPTAVGVSMFTFIGLLAGMLGWLSIMGGLVAVFFLAGAYRVWKWIHFEGQRLPSGREVLAGLLAGIPWLLAWLWVTIPPTFFDELSYHLVVPERGLATGTLPLFPWVFFMVMPHATDVLLAWGMALGAAFEQGGILGLGAGLGARAMVWTLWIVANLLGGTLLARISRPDDSVWALPLAATAFAVSPTLWFVATLPFGEVTVMVGVLAAFVILVHRAVPTNAGGPAEYPWVLLAMVCGLIGGAKLTGIYWIAGILAAALIAGWSWRAVGHTIAVAVLCMVPWWTRALVLTGNPIYPMAYDLLGGKFWSSESTARVMADVAGSGIDLGFQGLVTLPWNLIRHPEQFGSAANVGGVAVAAVLLVLALPIIGRRVQTVGENRRFADMAAVFLCVALTGWMCTSLVTRFLTPAFAVALLALTGMGLTLQRAVRTGVVVVLVLSSVWGTMTFLREHEDVFASTRVALGQETREAYLARRLDHMGAARFVRQHVAENARLLFIGETRPYYFERDSLAPTAYDVHPLERWTAEARSPEALAARLATEGVTHVVLNVREFKRLRQSYGLLEFEAKGDQASERRLKELPAHLHLLFKENGVYVFEVPGSAGKQSMEAIHG